MYQNMNESLLKSFDNIMHQQTKMDYKAYIFIGFISLTISLLITNNYAGSKLLFVYFGILFIPLFISLLPKATSLAIKSLDICNKKTENSDHNIFYYLDICHLTKAEYINVLKNEYDIENLTKSDIKLIEQILINSKILKIKVSLHSVFQYILLIGLILFVLPYLCELVTFILSFANKILEIFFL